MQKRILPVQLASWERLHCNVKKSCDKSTSNTFRTYLVHSIVLGNGNMLALNITGEKAAKAFILFKCVKAFSDPTTIHLRKRTGQPRPLFYFFLSFHCAFQKLSGFELESSEKMARALTSKPPPQPPTALHKFVFRQA